MRTVAKAPDQEKGLQADLVSAGVPEVLEGPNLLQTMLLGDS